MWSQKRLPSTDIFEDEPSHPRILGCLSLIENWSSPGSSFGRLTMLTWSQTQRLTDRYGLPRPQRLLRYLDQLSARLILASSLVFRQQHFGISCGVSFDVCWLGQIEALCNRFVISFVCYHLHPFWVKTTS